MLVSKDTLLYYHRILGYIVSTWIEEGVTEPEMINKNHINGMLASIANGGGSDSYVHIHARCIRTFMNFMVEADLIAAPIKFSMPKIHQKKLPVLTEEQVPIVLKACRTLRNRALVMMMVDTGLRLSEVAALDWNDVDLETGLVFVQRGKGGKPRSVVAGASARRAILAYKRTLVDKDENYPLFQTADGARLSTGAIKTIMDKLWKKTGIHVTCHALRRTFATQSLRSGMNLVYLQTMMGHTSVELTRRYIQTIDDDLLEEHRRHGPLDKIMKYKR
ncbi:MAG: tyrosine-type recombinase/integrase [Chloroflexota bacterium]